MKNARDCGRFFMLVCYRSGAYAEVNILENYLRFMKKMNS